MSDHVTSPEQEDAKPRGGRQRSTIAFPYMDLDSATEVARTIHNNVGNGTCSLHQLAAWLKLSSKSSGFRVQIAASRLFGFISSEGTDSYCLTALGKKFCDPSQEATARVEAFRSVPLFEKLYHSHKEGVLPSSQALEHEIAALGVAAKQKDRARQVFERSADQAGFFEHGRNRLVLPAIRRDDEQRATEAVETPGPASQSTNPDLSELDLDPLLMALLRKIPPPSEGWPVERRVRWLKTFAMNISQVYDAEDATPVDIDIRSEGRPKASTPD